MREIQILVHRTKQEMMIINTARNMKEMMHTTGQGKTEITTGMMTTVTVICMKNIRDHVDTGHQIITDTSQGISTVVTTGEDGEE